MDKRIYTSIIIFGVSLGMLGCSSTKVQRVDINKPIDLSGQWNDTDSRLTAESAIEDCLKHSWINDFNKEAGRNPTVIVGQVINRSQEHINSQIFIKDLERAFVNSNKVQLVASRQERKEIRDERTDQEAGNTDPSTISRPGFESGADFMLQGSINSVKDEIKGQYAILYQVNLELIDMKTNRKKWIGQKEIKKSVKKSAYSL